MTPMYFLTLYQTELVKLFRRLTSHFGLSLSLLFGVLGPVLVLLFNWLNQMAADAAAEMPDQPPSIEIDALTAEWAVWFAFFLRGLLFLPILIFIMGGLTFAAEHANRSIREYALRPVPRWSLILSRWLALASWVFLACVVTFGTSLLLGMIFTGSIGEWQSACKDVGVAIAADLGFATLALSIAVFTRSVSATVASLVSVFVLQVLLWVGLGIAGNTLFRMWLENMLSGQAFIIDWFFWFVEYLSLWQPPFVVASSTGGASWQGFFTLFVIAFGSLLAALVRFQRMDLP